MMTDRLRTMLFTDYTYIEHTLHLLSAVFNSHFCLRYHGTAQFYFETLGNWNHQDGIQHSLAYDVTLVL